MWRDKRNKKKINYKKVECGDRKMGQGEVWWPKGKYGDVGELYQQFGHEGGD